MAWSTDYCEISPHNFDDKVVAVQRFRSNLKIADCTLRDGEQQPGVVFTPQDKIRIATKLNEMGVHEIEAGMPAVSKDDELAVREIVKLGLGATITALARARKADIDVVADCGASGVVLSLPSGFLQLEHKLHWSEDRVIEKALEMCAYAKSLGLYVSLSPYDTTRARGEFLDRYLTTVLAAGNVDRIRVVDTVGCIGPRAMYQFILHIRKLVGEVSIEVHCHNDFGLATATTLFAAEAGADVLSTTVNGLGERAGNTATEEVVLALKILYGQDLGIDLTQLQELSALVQGLSGIGLQPNKAVVGANTFSHESGLIVDGILEAPFVGESYAPELVGKRRQILLGKKSGHASIQAKLAESGLEVDEVQVDTILLQVKEKSIEEKRTLTDTEFSEICRGVLGAGRVSE